MSAGAEDVERLRRIAYGPDATPQERAEAEASLREIDLEEQAAAVEADSVRASEPLAEGRTDNLEDDPADIVDHEAVDEHDVEELSLWSRRIRVGWIIPIAVGAVLLGAAVGVGRIGQFDSAANVEASAPSPTGIDVPVDIPPIGDLSAADLWFDRPYEPSDAFPESSLLESSGIEEHDVRLALDGGDLGSVWVAQKADSLCLLIANVSEKTGAASCVQREVFEKTGLDLGSNDLSATWNGREVISDPYIAPRPTISAPGSGDVDGANAWFDSPLTEQDVYPMSGILVQMGVDPAQVRLVGRSESGPKVWAMKQGNTGFCLASYDPTQDRGQGQGKGEWNCATMEEFEAHGLTLTTSTVAAAWDGAMIAMSGR